MRRLTATDAKYPPRELSQLMGKANAPEYEHLLRLAEAGRFVELDRALADHAEALRAQILNHRNQVIVSPFSNVSDEEWAEAREEAARVLWEVQGVDRSPTDDETEAALESLRERNAS
jgi:hypothetical protein